MSILTRDKILYIINDYAPGIHGLRRVGLVGSYARNDFTESSDLDLVFDLDNTQKDGTLTEAAATLRLILMNQFRKKLDIIKYDSIHQYLELPINMYQRKGYEKMLEDLAWIWEADK